MKELSIEQLAELSADDALRRRIDEKNSASLAHVTLALAGVSAALMTRPLIYLLGGVDRRVAPLALALSSLIVALVAMVAVRAIVRDDRRMKWLQRRLSAFTGSFLAAEFALMLLAISVPTTTALFLVYLGYVSLYPIVVVLWFRFLTAELILLHAFLFAAAALNTLQIPPNEGPRLGVLIAMEFLWNAGALGAGMKLTGGLRKSVAAEYGSARDAARMRDELRTARDLQLSMLPDAAPILDWADIAGISIPATEVGGDYYDYFIVEGGLAVVCADVAGHGLASGITLSTLRGALMLVGDSLMQPAAVLQRLSAVVAQSSRRRMLVTMSLLLFDRSTRKATIGSAGHPPLIVRRAGGAMETVEMFSPPLGSRLLVKVPQTEIAFAPGDVFVLHSDGIYETADSAGEQYGMERLLRLVASLPGSASQIRDGILHEIARFRGDRPQEDDVTLVVVKIA